ncbi:MAG: energy-coupling factor transporter transmembrane component T [Rubrobacteraceae bacterium]
MSDTLGSGDSVARTDDEFIDSFRQPMTQGNWVRDMNPLSVFLILGALPLIAVAVSGILAPSIICVTLVLIAFVGGVGRSFTVTYFKLWIAIGLLLFVLRSAFFEGGNVLFTVGKITVSTEGLMDGLRFSLLVMAFSGAVTLYFALVPIKYLTLALELKGVSPRATYVLLAAFQAITDLGKNARVIMDAQKSRGIETEGNIIQRVKAFVPVLAPVFLSAMAATEEKAIALDARAFNSREAHSHLVSLRATPAWEIVLVVFSLLGVVVACAVAVLSWY